MINHDNYKAMCEYLRYETEVFMLDDATLERHESMVKHVLRWLDYMPLNDAPRQRPVLAVYLQKAGGADGNELSEIGIKRICREVRNFFTQSAHQLPTPVSLHHAGLDRDVAPAQVRSRSSRRTQSCHAGYGAASKPAENRHADFSRMAGQSRLFLPIHIRYARHSLCHVAPHVLRLINAHHQTVSQVGRAHQEP